MPSSEEISRFISASFRSVWSLELLLLLKAKPGYHHRDELVANLRASELIVDQAIQSLIAAGLVGVDETGGATYMPVSQDVAKLVEQTADLYGRKPDAVRRMIVSASAPGLSAFAEAFRLKKD